MFRQTLIAAALAFTATTSLSNAANLVSDVDALTVPASKQTLAEKYLSPLRANAILEQHPNILFIDVRDPLEVALMGHPMGIDKIVPVQVQSDVYDDELQQFQLVQNVDFLKDMKATLDETGKSKHDAIFIICGSGHRSAKAVNILVADGYSNVWHIPEGYSGDGKAGMNTENAWRNANLPWSKNLVPQTPWIKVFAKHLD